jgi:hypothetical protein
MPRWLWQRTIVPECSKLARKAMTFTTRNAMLGSSFRIDLVVKMNLIGPKRSNVQTDFFVHFIATDDIRVLLGDHATLAHPADDLRLAPNFLFPTIPGLNPPMEGKYSRERENWNRSDYHPIHRRCPSPERRLRAGENG